MATLNRYCFHDGRHLNDTGISLVAGAMREDAAGRVPAELLAHVETCPKCQAAILSFTELLDELYDSDQQALFENSGGFPQRFAMPEPKGRSLLKRFRSPGFGIQGGLILFIVITILVILGVIYTIRSGTTSRYNETEVTTSIPDSAETAARDSVKYIELNRDGIISITDDPEPPPFNNYRQSKPPVGDIRQLIFDASGRTVSGKMIPGNSEVVKGIFVVKRTQPDRSP